MEDVKKDDHHQSEHREGDQTERDKERSISRNGTNHKPPTLLETNTNNDDQSTTIVNNSSSRTRRTSNLMTSKTTTGSSSNSGNHHHHHHTHNSSTTTTTTKPLTSSHHPTPTTTSTNTPFKVSISSLDCPSYLLYGQQQRQPPPPKKLPSMTSTSLRHSSTDLDPSQDGTIRADGARPQSTTTKVLAITAPPSQRTRKIQPSTFLDSFRINSGDNHKHKNDTTTTTTTTITTTDTNQIDAADDPVTTAEDTTINPTIAIATTMTRTAVPPPVSTLRSESRLRKRQSRITTTMTTNPDAATVTSSAIVDHTDTVPVPTKLMNTNPNHDTPSQRPQLRSSSSTSRRHNRDRKSKTTSDRRHPAEVDTTAISTTNITVPEHVAVPHLEPSPPVEDPTKSITTNSRTKVVTQTRLQRRSSLRHNNNNNKDNKTNRKTIHPTVEEPITPDGAASLSSNVPVSTNITNNNNHHSHNNESTTSLDLNDLLLASTDTETNHDVDEPKTTHVGSQPSSSSTTTTKRKSVRTTTTRNGVVGISSTRHSYKSPLKQRIVSSTTSTSTNTNPYLNHNAIHKSPRAATMTTNSKSRNNMKDLSSSTTSISLLQKLNDLQQLPNTTLHVSGTGLDLNRSIRW